MNLGSGKSYTMMGTQNNPGIIPRLCNALFDRIKRLKAEDPSLMCKVHTTEFFECISPIEFMII